MRRLLSSPFAALLVLAPRVLAAQDAGSSPLPEWRESGVCYEIFVRSFHDSDGDGVGDLRGLIAKLDYINDGDAATDSDLGARCIWLMPVAQSPSYHGYDVTNYYEINRDYGTNEDFRRLVAEAGRRGIRIVVDLVANHMSSEHPYFKSALLDAASPYRDWFTWSPTIRPSPGWTAPLWHPAGTREEFYYGLFWHGMPDINLANPDATAELKEVARFWLEDMGVAGFRMDAVGHFFEGPDGQWKNGPGVHPWLRDYASFIRGVRADAFTIGEVWDDIEAIRPYYPDQLDSYFIFEVADALVDAVRTGVAGSLIADIARAQRDLPRGRWSPFLRNHDQTRVMTALGGDVARARLAATLLLTLPGFPFLYYGEELGMTGDKPDPRLRTPMHWSLEPAAGFTRGTPWEPLPPDSFTANVAVQAPDPGSLLNHYRRLIRLRAAHPALGASADFIPVSTGHAGVIAYLRRTERQSVLVIANLSAERVSRVALSAGAAALPAGGYVARALLGETPGAALRVRADGQIRDWVALPRLEPHAVHVFELSRSN